MKIFGVDVSIKYIFFELEGKKYQVSFRDSFFRGVYDIEVRSGIDGKGYAKTSAAVEAVYPNFRERMKEIWLRLPKHLFRSHRRSRSQ